MRLLSRHVFRILLIPGASVLAIFTILWFWQRSPIPQPVPSARQIPTHQSNPGTSTSNATSQPGNGLPPDYKPSGTTGHPIDYLIKKSEIAFDNILAKQTHSLAAAAQAYRKRRGRHPPPGFEKWWEYANGHGAVIVEDFFDQIYDDLTPFWGLEAKTIRSLAKDFPTTISVRDGNARMKTDEQRPWMDLWLNMTQKIEAWLPDVDIPINVMDESRVIVPWDKINEYVQAERDSRTIVPAPQVLTKNKRLVDVPLELESRGSDDNIKWLGPSAGPFWDTAVVACSPSTPAYNISSATTFTGPPPLPPQPRGSFSGYVQNWTSAKDPCQDPDIRTYHGTFVEPVSISTTHDLIPMFSGSKLPLNNDILIPAAMYWPEDPRFTVQDNQKGGWKNKKSQLMWRGGGSGGRNRRENWTRFQRHRFVAMVNGTAVRDALNSTETPGVGPNFVLPPEEMYDLTVTQYMDLGTWLDDIADVGIVHLTCFPATGGPLCPYTDPYFKIVEEKTLKEQFGYKYLPDIDGNSFSGRYRSFLLSSSLPIKATIYSEWHDSRLVPWVHFVPMDNSFVDMYGILDYFLGTGVQFEDEVGTPGAHDEAAEKIAVKGKEWAEKVLRREDMLIYYMRLLMEYARVSDDERGRLGFVGDLEGVQTQP